jgi:hypothetical protein
VGFSAAGCVGGDSLRKTPMPGVLGGALILFLLGMFINAIVAVVRIDDGAVGMLGIEWVGSVIVMTVGNWYRTSPIFESLWHELWFLSRVMGTGGVRRLQMADECRKTIRRK